MCCFSFNKFAGSIPAFTCASVINNLSSIFLGVNILIFVHCACFLNGIFKGLKMFLQALLSIIFVGNIFP